MVKNKGFQFDKKFWSYEKKILYWPEVKKTDINMAV